jgi:uncharacterized protein YjbI with pentapeptide repeats
MIRTMNEGGWGMASRPKASPAKGKLAGKTVAFVGKFGYHDMFLPHYQNYALAEGATVVDAESAVPDYLVAGEGRGGNPPAVVAKVTKLHRRVQVLEVVDFCRLLTPSREELCAELRAGRGDHERWEQLVVVFQRSGTTLDLSGIDLRKADLYGANLTFATLDGADLRGTSAHYAHFGNLRGVKFDGADLSHVYFMNAEDCSFRKATMTEAWLHAMYGQSQRFERCDFTGAKLNQAGGGNCQFVDCTFSAADLSDAEIEHVDLSGANLERADLSRAHCSNTKFAAANLTEAVLFRADLRNASLTRADLHQADLREAVLSGADLTGAQVDGADFTGSVLNAAKIAGLDGSRAKGFTPPVVRHAGPKLRELGQVAADSKRFETEAELDLGKAEHAKLTLAANNANNRSFVSAQSKYRRDDNEAYDRIDAPTFVDGMLNFAVRWPGAKLRLDTIRAKGSKSLRGKKLIDLATAAWAEAFGLEAAAPADLERQKAEQQAAVQKLREAMLRELKGGPGGVKKWNARANRDREQLGPLPDLDLKGAKLDGIVMARLDLSGSKFAGASLKNAKLWSCQLQKANFTGANLAGCNLDFSHCEDASFQDAKMVGCSMSITYFSKANFRDADLKESDLTSARLEGADFTGASLTGVALKSAYYDVATKFPNGFVPPETMAFVGPPPEAIVSQPVPPGSMDVDTFYKQLGYNVEAARLQKAAAMLKSERFQLYADVKDNALVGVVKSQSDADLVYSCRLTSSGEFSCCTQNLKPCGGLRGALCKHLLVLLVGLARSGRLDPATADAWVLASKTKKPAIDKDVMSETFLRYKGAEAGEIDWRPTETVPEDYYAL